MNTNKEEFNETANEDVLTASPETESRDLIWLLNCVLVTGVAVFLRFFWLGLKPLHHDEGVNGFFLTTLFREGVYKYDPANYHGPDLYYISLVFTKIFGLNTLSVRWSVAIFGVLTVALAFFLKNYIGKTGSLFAAFFLALSPGMVYISRYFIHEILFIFFSFGIVLALLFFIEKRKAGPLAIFWMALVLLVCFLPSALNLANVLGGKNETALWMLRIAFFLVEAVLVFVVMRMLLAWNDGHPIYLLLAAVSACLLFATKETAFITIGTMLIACGSVWLWRKIETTEDYQKNKFWVFGGILTAPLVVFLVYSAVSAYFGATGDSPRCSDPNLSRFQSLLAYLGNDCLIGTYKSFSENFLSLNDPYQNYLFYTILSFVGLSLTAWIIFIFGIRQGQDFETALFEPAELTWTRFRERLEAASLSEFLLVKSSLASITILLLWLLVRVVIEFFVKQSTAEAVKAPAGTLTKNAGFWTNVDFAILGIALGFLAIAAIVWQFRRPPKISADFLLLSVASTVVFLYVWILFFSSFFTYPEGIEGSFKAYAIWTQTGNTDHTQNGLFAFLRWGMLIESPILILSALGFLIALVKARHRFALFCGFWAFGLFLAYTIIPYKTPWLALSFLLPMCISAGYAVNELVTARRLPSKISGFVLAIAATAILAFQTYDINFVRYDDDRMPYIYAHTKREFLDLIKKIEYYADKSGQGKNAKIEIVSPDYWPMPWYLNDYPNAIFQGKLVDANTAEMIVAKKDEQDAEMMTRYSAHYKYAGTFPLRPGPDLVLLVRKDLADSDAQEIFAITGTPISILPDDASDDDSKTNSP